MIPSNGQTILLLTIPRTGTHFLQYLMFECEGRIVPVDARNWLAGNNPISYTPDHCLIVEHFHPVNIDVINEILASGEDIRVVIPMQDLMQSFISAKTMQHTGFFAGIDTFLQMVDSIPHHKYLLDGKKTKKKEIEDLLTFTGLTATNEKKAKYKASPVINSARPDDSITQESNPNEWLKREVHDDAKAKYAAGDIEAIRTYWPDVDLLLNDADLKLKLKDFGYNKADISWI